MFFNLTHSKYPTIEKFIGVLTSVKFDQNKAERLLPKVNKNYRFDDGDTLLDLCLRKKRFKAASWLVRQGIEITTRNRDNISTVRMAIESGEIVIIEDIVKYADFNINQVDANGRSLLQDAVILGYNEISRILIDQNIDVNIKDKFNRNVIFDAINYGNREIVDTILDVEGLELNNIDVNGDTVMHMTPVLNNDELAIRLLKKGANPSIFNKEGYNFLTYTALRGEEGQEVLDIAIEHGCNLNVKNSSKNTVLMEVLHSFSKISNTEIERRKELKKVAKKLIDGGSAINEVDKYGETMIFTMIRKGDRDGCAFVLENGIDPNQRNGNMETPLHVAVLKGTPFLDMILLLLQYDADPTQKNKYDQSVPELLNEAILQVYKLKTLSHKEYLPFINPDGQYMVVLKEIISLKKFNFNYLDSNGDPLFFLPFLYGDIKTTQLYLVNGFNINQKNKEGDNLFFKFVLRCFEKGEYFKTFSDYLKFLLINKADISHTNKNGQMIASAAALIPNCDLKLFRKLVEFTKQDYFAVDNLGRTIIHNCVFGNNLELMKLVYGVEQNIQNIPDKYNLLPITYAALFGYQDIVVELLRKNALINSGKPVASEMKMKFQSFLKNLSQLPIGIEDEIMLRKIKILTEQTLKDLSL